MNFKFVSQIFRPYLFQKKKKKSSSQHPSPPHLTPPSLLFSPLLFSNALSCPPPPTPPTRPHALATIGSEVGTPVSRALVIGSKVWNPGPRHRMHSLNRHSIGNLPGRSPLAIGIPPGPSAARRALFSIWILGAACRSSSSSPPQPVCELWFCKFVIL